MLAARLLTMQAKLLVHDHDENHYKLVQLPVELVKQQAKRVEGRPGSEAATNSESNLEPLAGRQLLVPFYRH